MENLIQRAILTGATGFIGSHLAKRLVQDNWNIDVICRSNSDLSGFSGMERTTLHVHDGTMNGMLNIFKNLDQGIVFHLASVVLSENTTDDIDPLLHGNISFATQLVEAMVKTDHFHLINTGTFSQHFNGESYNPVNLYSATKEAYKSILRYYTETTHLKVITLELAHVYGPNGNTKLFQSIRRAVDDQKPLALSPGEQFLDCIYVDDAVEAFMVAKAILQDERAPKYKDYAVSSGKPIKIKDIVQIYETTINVKVPVIWGARPYRAREMMFPWKWEQGKQLPEWQPKIDLQEGILRMEYENKRHKSR